MNYSKIENKNFSYAVGLGLGLIFINPSFFVKLFLITGVAKPYYEQARIFVLTCSI